MQQPIRFGLVGYKFMGKAHSNALARLPMFFPESPSVSRQAICGRDAAGVRSAAGQLGWQSYETDWRRLVDRDDIDVIDITAPSNAHHEIAIAAARAGKHVFCEKPLALTLDDARGMADAVRKTGVTGQIGFNYRFAPAIQMAHQLIASGRLGTIYHFRGQYLQDFIVDPQFPRVWRLDRSVCGSGALGDIGAHLIDLARYLVGDIREVSGMSRTFIRERPLPSAMTGLSASADETRRGVVDVDDATSFVFGFTGGAMGTIEATRFAQGNKNGMSFEINGSKGSLRFHFERMNELEWYDAADPQTESGFRVIQCTEAAHPYMSAWWPVGHVIGYEHTFVHEMADFVRAVSAGQPASPDFADGVAVSQIMEAVELSIDRRAWVEVASL